MINKRIVRRITLSILLLLLTISLPLFTGIDTLVHAATCGGVETSIINCEEGGDGGINHLLVLIIDIFSIGIGILAVVGISWAGIQFLTARDDVTKVTKAKRRIYEIVLGLAVYAVLWGATQWLLPGGKFNPGQDDSNISQIDISFANQVKVGQTFKPTVTINEDANDKTYSLLSSDKKTITTLGNVAKCVKAGTSTITAVAANGIKSQIDVNCEEDKDEGKDNDKDDDKDDDDSSDTTTTVGSQADVPMKHKTPKMRKETNSIVNKHKTDFYHSGSKSYKKVVLGKNSQYGSYKKYVQSLGGIFEQLVDKGRIKVETAADLQLAAEYVFGLWTIWGPDYNTGSYFQKWTSDDAFYNNEGNRSGRSAIGNKKINTVLSQSATNSINTYCDKSLNILIKSTTLKMIHTGQTDTGFRNTLKQSGYYSSKPIYYVDKLKVGDLIHVGSHITMVGEVYKDYVVTYDGGSRFQRSQNYKKKIQRTHSRTLGGTYGSTSWVAWRPWNIDQSVTLGGLN